MTDDATLRALAERVGAMLRRQGRVVTAAESCTAGWIAKALTDVPGSSGWFEEGFVTYSDEAKARRLGVRSQTLAKHGAVSEHTVIEMAKGALRASGAQQAVAVSGIAGPDGGTPDKPVGTVWFAWAWDTTPPGRHGVAQQRYAVTTAVHRFEGDRDAVRRQTVAAALEGFLREHEPEV